jgi:hypothetical protein
MSIDPVQFVPVQPVELAFPDKTKAQSAPPSPGSTAGSVPNEETPDFPPAAEPDFVPSEEVKVQRDYPTGQQVYQFIDRRSGILVLQIPSEQMLNFIHEVQQEWQQLTSKPANGNAGGKGE